MKFVVKSKKAVIAINVYLVFGDLLVIIIILIVRVLNAQVVLARVLPQVVLKFFFLIYQYTITALL